MDLRELTDRAAELNRATWDSFRRQRDEGLSECRRDSAQDILDGTGYLRREYIELAGDVTGKRLLDMGCGEAAETLEWARLGAEVVGVDNSPKQIEAGLRNAEKLGLTCRLIQADLLKLPEELLTGEFDIVYSAYVTAWIGDKDRWFAHVYRALRPGGVFLLGSGHPLGDYIHEEEEDPGFQDSYFSEGPIFIESDSKNDFNPAGAMMKNIEWCHTLGTIVTAVAQSGLRITHLVELPPSEEEEHKIKGLPAGYILRAVSGYGVLE